MLKCSLFIIIIIIISSSSSSSSSSSMIRCFCNWRSDCLLGMLINVNWIIPFNDAALTAQLFPDAKENVGKDVVIKIEDFLFRGYTCIRCR